MTFGKQLRKRKFLFIVLAAGIAVAGYYGYQKITAKETPTRYVLASVTRGTLIESVSGSGQVATSNQVDVKPKASGDLIALPITEGQDIKANTVMARLDATDALKTVRDAQTNLESARISLQKLQQPPDALSLTQAHNALDQANQSKTNAEANLTKAYEDGFNAVANAFLDLPTIMSGLQDILYSRTLNYYQANLDYFANSVKQYDDRVTQYRDTADTTYQTAKTKYDLNFTDYKATSRYADTATLEKLIAETLDTTKNIAEAVKNTINLIGFYENQLTAVSIKAPATVNTYNANLQTYTGRTNSHVSTLLNIQNTIRTTKDSIVNADQTIKEREGSLAELQAGADPLDIASQELTIKQRQNSLADAQAQLADYTVRAPFDGVVAAVNVKVRDTASSGTAIATIITKQKIAEVFLNEVDAAQVSAGQKATLTFDAIEGLEITGAVSSIETLGTVSSGVVNYTAKIAFDTQDARIKSGMSVTAAIITSAKTDVLLVPNAAVKTSNGERYVEMLDAVTTTGNTAANSQGVTSPTPPRQQAVTVGASNDTSTEITDGLKEGDQVVLRTATANTAATRTTTSGFGIPGLGGGNPRGGFMMR